MDQLSLRPVAGVVLRDERARVLLMRRSVDDTRGIPGSGLEPGESWSAAALRECREETGWKGRIDELLGIYRDPSTQVHRYPGGALRHFVGVVVLATAIERVGTPDDETAELRWVTSSDLPTSLSAPDIPVLRDAFDTSSSRPVIA